MFKVCGIIGISNIKFFNFSGTERVNYLDIYFCIYLECRKEFCANGINGIYGKFEKNFSRFYDAKILQRLWRRSIKSSRI